MLSSGAECNDTIGLLAAVIRNQVHSPNLAGTVPHRVGDLGERQVATVAANVLGRSFEALRAQNAVLPQHAYAGTVENPIGSAIFKSGRAAKGSPVLQRIPPDSDRIADIVRGRFRADFVAEVR